MIPSIGRPQGNSVKVGNVFSMVITRVSAQCVGYAYVTEDTSVQGQVFLDGPGTLWVIGRQQGITESRWFEPKRV